MTETLKLAFEAASRLPADRQEELARFVLALSQNPATALTPDEVAAIAEAEAELARGEYAPSEAIDAFWLRNGL